MVLPLTLPILYTYNLYCLLEKHLTKAPNRQPQDGDKGYEMHKRRKNDKEREKSSHNHRTEKERPSSRDKHAGKKHDRRLTKRLTSIISTRGNRKPKATRKHYNRAEKKRNHHRHHYVIDE